MWVTPSLGVSGTWRIEAASGSGVEWCVCVGRHGEFLCFSIIDHARCWAGYRSWSYGDACGCAPSCCFSTVCAVLPRIQSAQLFGIRCFCHFLDVIRYSKVLLLPVVFRVHESHAMVAERDAECLKVVSQTTQGRSVIVKDLYHQCKLYAALCGTEARNVALSDRGARNIRHCEKNIHALLLKAGWVKRRADWSAEWWATEIVWIAPWVSSLGKIFTVV